MFLDRIILFPLVRGNGAEVTEVTQSVCGDQHGKAYIRTHKQNMPRENSVVTRKG